MTPQEIEEARQYYMNGMTREAILGLQREQSQVEGYEDDRFGGND